MLIVTNTPASVLAAIDKIAATSSKIEKEALIQQAGASSLFMKVVRAAYDPFINYGIRQIPERAADAAPGSNSLTEETWWTMLTDLAERRLSGDAARAAVQRGVNFLDDASRELFIRIIRKDLRAGFSEGTVNRVFPKTFADFPYMRCSLPDKSNMADWDWAAGIISQEKADGMFANVNKDNQGNVWLTTRQGSPIPLDKLPYLVAAIEAIIVPGTQSHGELTVLDPMGKVLPREVGNGMLNSVLNGGDVDEGCKVRLDLWDQIPLSEVKSKGKYNVPYKTRLRELISQVGAHAHEVHKPYIGIVPTRLVKSKAQAYAHYRDLLKQGKEGTICKHPEAIWRDGTSKDQVKLKLEVDVELEVVQVLPGTPGTKNEGKPGSLQCASKCGRLQVNVTVKNEAMRVAIDQDWDAWAGKIMTVRANSIMQPSDSSGFFSLFLPRFVEDQARIDKAVADDLETIEAIFRNAVEAA